MIHQVGWLISFWQQLLFQRELSVSIAHRQAARLFQLQCRSFLSWNPELLLPLHQKHVRSFEPTGSFIMIRKKSQVTKHGSVSRSVVGAVDAG